jgi:plastocyanin
VVVLSEQGDWAAAANLLNEVVTALSNFGKRLGDAGGDEVIHELAVIDVFVDQARRGINAQDVALVRVAVDLSDRKLAALAGRVDRLMAPIAGTPLGSVSLGNVAGQVGTTVAMPIEVKGVPEAGLGTFGLTLTYDAKILRARLVDILYGTGVALVNIPGRVKLVGLATIDVQSGDIPIAEVIFDVINAPIRRPRELPAAGEGEVVISMHGEGDRFFFDPVAVVIEPGTTVTWAIASGGTHRPAAYPDLVPPGAEAFVGPIVDEHLPDPHSDQHLDSPSTDPSTELGARLRTRLDTLPQSENHVPLKWSYTFEQPGTYVYRCTIHWAVGMQGIIIVREPGGPGEARPGNIRVPTTEEILAAGHIAWADYAAEAGWLADQAAGIINFDQELATIRQQLDSLAKTYEAGDTAKARRMISDLFVEFAAGQGIEVGARHAVPLLASRLGKDFEKGLLILLDLVNREASADTVETEIKAINRLLDRAREAFVASADTDQHPGGTRVTDAGNITVVSIAAAELADLEGNPYEPQALIAGRVSVIEGEK